MQFIKLFKMYVLKDIKGKLYAIFMDRNIQYLIKMLVYRINI